MRVGLRSSQVVANACYAVTGNVPAVHVAVTTEAALATDADTVAVGVVEGETVESTLVRSLLDAGEAKPAFKHLSVTHSDGRRVIVAGLGARDRFDPEAARIAAAVVGERARELGARHLCWELPRGGDGDRAAGLVEGTVLGGYRFTRYRRAPDAPTLERLSISAPAGPDVTGAAHRASVLAAAQNRARDLGNRAPNDLTPTALADYAAALGERHVAVTVTVLDEDELRDRGMGAFAAVAQGSAEPAKLITLEYDGALGDGGRLALVGKAVTFDSGGLSLKPPNSMIEMKFDMMGGAAVIEAIGALAELQVPVRVLGVVGATENLVSDRSVKPGDVVTALDGTTIEVNNTDAEGRLVLADCITHARRLGGDTIVDIATLTGGVVVALGAPYAGLMASDDALAAQLIACGEHTGELLWRLPLHPAYAEMVKGHYAQLTNRTQRREASAITGAEFLHHFAGAEPWAHLDIAAVGDDGRALYLDKGGTGFGVRLLAELATRRA
jgi:leucyl aminopeptidase